jgi:hypothetical protein
VHHRSGHTAGHLLAGCVNILRHSSDSRDLTLSTLNDFYDVAHLRIFGLVVLQIV